MIGGQALSNGYGNAGGLRVAAAIGVPGALVVPIPNIRSSDDDEGVGATGARSGGNDVPAAVAWL